MLVVFWEELDITYIKDNFDHLLNTVYSDKTRNTRHQSSTSITWGSNLSITQLFSVKYLDITCYADVIALLVPSATRLQKMLDEMCLGRL